MGHPLATDPPAATPIAWTAGGWPILYEDDEEGDMGESNPHVVTDEILHICLRAHFAGRPRLRVFSNMNLYYQDPTGPPVSPTPYVSPDSMVVEPTQPLGDDVTSYTVGRDGPSPLLAGEILSKRTAQQRDLDEKMILYAKLRVREYVLIDVTGDFLPQRLLLKRLQPDGTWVDEQDADGGVTSALGFRLLIDAGDRLQVIDTATGEPYPVPWEAVAQVRALRAALDAEAEARRRVEERNRQLEAEIARLRGNPPPSIEQRNGNAPPSE
jgi:Uma2 family endonuclease